MSAHGRHRASGGKGSGHHGSHRRSRGVIFSVFEITIMILFGTLGVLVVLLAHSIGGRRHEHRQQARQDPHLAPAGDPAPGAPAPVMEGDRVCVEVRARHQGGPGPDDRFSEEPAGSDDD